MPEFNPNSTDAVLARILTNQEEHTQKLREIRDEARKTNGRVTSLERERWYQRGVVAAVAVVVTMAWDVVRGR